MGTPVQNSPLSRELELNRIVSLDEGARLGGVSRDTLKRHKAHKIIQLSPRRKGIRVRDALGLA
jgi:hypothetical protein